MKAKECRLGGLAPQQRINTKDIDVKKTWQAHLRTLTWAVMSMALLACSPQDDAVPQASHDLAQASGVEVSITPTAAPAANEVSTLASRVAVDDVAEVALDERLIRSLAQAGQGVQDDSGWLQAVETDFVAGQVRACLRLRSAVLTTSETELAQLVRVSPEVAQLGLTLEGGKLCAQGLSADKRYTLRVEPGLRLRDGQQTGRPIEASVSLASLPKAVGFKGGGFVLAKGSAKGVQIVTTNVERVVLELVRVPERAVAQVVNRIQSGETQMDTWALRQLLQDAAVPVWSGSVTVDTRPNESTSTVLPVQRVMDGLPPGAYALMARDAADPEALMPSNMFADNISRDYWDRANVQWLLSTNLAVSAAQSTEGMWVSVRSLDQAAPVVSAEVDVITRNNDVVYRGVTSERGQIQVPQAAVHGVRANAPSHLVVRHQGDFAWLSLRGASLDLSAFDVAGRQVPGELDAFVYTDRGIYRPAELVHVNGLVRDHKAQMPEVGALNLLVYRPNGSLYEKVPLTLGHLASFQERVTLPRDASRGVWRMVVALQRDDNEVLGRTDIDVQDFVPERLKVSAQSERPQVAPGERMAARVQADFLYGAPASDLGVEAVAVLSAPKAAELAELGLSGFAVGDALQAHEASSVLAPELRTDASGKALLGFESWTPKFAQLPAFGVASMPLYARLDVGVREPGGRATQTQTRLSLLPGHDVLALKPLFKDSVDTSSSATFEVRRLGAALQTAPVGPLRWKVQPWSWHWHYDRAQRRWLDERRLSSSVVAQGEVQAMEASPQLGRIDLAPLEWGGYVLTVFDEAKQIYTRQAFYSGWSSNASAEAPDLLDIVASAQAFEYEQDLTIGVESPFSGQAVVNVWANGLKHQETLTLSKGRNTLTLKPQRDWFPGAYVSVQALRPLGDSGAENPLSAQRYLPVRAMGVLYLAAQTKRKLVIDLPEATPMSPRQTQALDIAVPQLAGQQAYAVVQAVDEGILQLTRFKTPAPEDHFFAKRALTARFFDDYNKLLRADGAVGDIKTGGDAVTAGGASLPVVPTKSVVVYAGPVALDAQGRAAVPLDLPDFNGTLRVMATVWSADAFGSAERYWVTRDPVVAEAVLPRYLAPGDESTVTVVLANTTQVAQTVRVRLSGEGAIEVPPQTLDTQLAPGERGQFTVPIGAQQEGTGQVRLDIETEEGMALQRSWDLSARYAGQAQRTQGPALTLPANGYIEVGVAFPADTHVKGRSAVVRVHEANTVDAAAALATLLGYPYTCSEQTVSKAWPVLQAFKLDPDYVAQAAKPELGLRSVREWLQDNVDRIIARQSSTGEIGLWREGDGLVDPLLSTSLVGFLASAADAGFKLPPQAVASAYQWSHQLILADDDLDSAQKVETLAALVKNMAPHSKRVIRLARALSEEVGQSSAIAQLRVAVALRELGDIERAERLLGEDLNPTNVLGMTYYWSRLAVTGEFAELWYRLERPERAKALERALAWRLALRSSGWLSVAEAGQMLRVAVARSTANPLQLEIDGKRVESRLGAVTVRVPDDVLNGERASVRVQSLTPRPLQVFTQMAALPKQEAVLKAEGQGFNISKSLYDLSGQALPTNLSSAQVHQRFVVLLHVSAERASGRVQTMIKDPVPAGFQIESVITPAQRDEAYRWLPELSRVDVVQVQDDALFAASLRNWGRYAEEDLLMAYVLRATTAGRYMPAQAIAEDMYNSDLYGASAAQSMAVRAR